MNHLNKYPATRRVVFYEDPPSNKGKYKITLGAIYSCRLINPLTALYSTTDNNGVKFNISMYGASRYNGGRWRILADDETEQDVDFPNFNI